MNGLIFTCLCFVASVSAQGSQTSGQIIVPPRTLSQRVPPQITQRMFPQIPPRIFPPNAQRRFPPQIGREGDERQICAQYGEEPTYESNGEIQRCVWTIPPCRGREVICRTNGSSYICCQRPFCRDGTRSQAFCNSDRDCPIGYLCENYERNYSGICCQRHVTNGQYVR